MEPHSPSTTSFRSRYTVMPTAEPPIATVDAAGKEGEKMEFTDKGAPQGIHKYYVIAVNDKGEGVETFIEAFVGRDVLDRSTT